MTKKGLPSGVFSLPPERNNGDNYFSPFTLNKPWVFDAALRCGILPEHIKSEQFFLLQNQLILEQWWWNYED